MNMQLTSTLSTLQSSQLQSISPLTSLNSNETTNVVTSTNNKSNCNLSSTQSEKITMNNSSPTNNNNNHNNKNNKMNKEDEKEKQNGGVGGGSLKYYYSNNNINNNNNNACNGHGNSSPSLSSSSSSLSTTTSIASTNNSGILNGNNHGGNSNNNNNSHNNNNNNNYNNNNSHNNNINHNNNLNNNTNTVNNNCNNNNNNSSSSKNRICRDFVRGVCRRKHCRYPHVVSPDLVVFCHDFQNASCPRVNCKFLHYTLQEEEFYRTYGEFPDFHSDNGMLVPCKERIMSGSCRHRECYLSTNEPVWNNPRAPPPPPPYRSNDCPPLPSLNDYRTSCEEFQAIKRSSRDVMDTVSYKRFREETERIDIMAVIRRFEEEQVMLRRRVEANEIKIAELRASNEYLMAQNAQLRLSNVQQQHHHQHQQCSNVVNPVTVTQTTAPQTPQSPQVIGGVSIQTPVQVQATPIVSIAAPPTQIIASASATPLAIAANTSQGQQLAITQQNINTSQPLAPTHTQQILGTSQITLAPAIAQGPSMGLTINTSQALAMSNATQPIISYPVMTHSILPH